MCFLANHNIYVDNPMHLIRRKKNALLLFELQLENAMMIKVIVLV